MNKLRSWIFAAVAQLFFAAVMPTFGFAALSSFGPIDPAQGFPIWYEDTTGLKLELCLDANDPLCLPPPENVDPTQPISFPDNFPEEAFWWAGSTSITVPGGGEILLVMALEAAFASTSGLPEPGRQIAFARIRIRGSGLPLGIYRITHPYGVETFVVSHFGAKQINFTEDIGVLPGDFSDALAGRIGPFLVWDPVMHPPAPEGYAGDPAIVHSVLGSPFGTNHLKVERIDGVAPVRVGYTEMFSVTGKVSVLSVYPNPAGGIFSAPPTVTLTASEPTAQIFYTTDLSDPVTSSTRVPYSGPVSTVAPSTTLKLYALGSGGAQSAVYTQTYVVDPSMLTVSANPAGGIYSTAQAITLTPSNGTATVYYTIDGSAPLTSQTRIQYVGPITRTTNGTTTLRFVATLATTNSKVYTQTYSLRIQILQLGPTNPENGFPIWYQDSNGQKLELCLNPGDQFCVAPPSNVNPANPIRFPANFPEEAFWWAASANVTTPGGGTVSLVMALEAAFSTASGLPAAGHRLAFGRIRIRASGLMPGFYRISHPYGVDHFQVNDMVARQINFTEDVLPVPEDFTYASASRIGPFLYWDPAVGPPAPVGYLGDPNLPHKVLGSPHGTNHLKVERINGGFVALDGFTDRFLIAGKLSALSVFAGPPGGSFSAPPTVTLTASFSPASIYFTGDGTDPRTSPTRVLYSGPIAMGSTGGILKFAAIDGGGNTSLVVTEVYAIDATAPTVTASPAGGSYALSQFVTLSASESADIFYTKDGSDPITSVTKAPYTVAIPITALGLTVLKFIAIDPAGNPSAVITENYVITDAPPVVTPPSAEIVAQARMGLDSISVNLSWVGTDDHDQIVRYDLEDSVNGQPFSPVLLPSPVAISVTVDLKLGSSHRFRVRAIDAVGNTSTWQDTAFQVVIDQENARNIGYSGKWIRASQVGASGGGVRSSTTSGAEARYKFTGTSVAWISEVSPRRGRADIIIDGVFAETVDMFSPVTTSRQVVFARSGLGQGEHTLTVRARGDRNPLSTSNQIDVDAFVRLQ